MLKTFCFDLDQTLCQTDGTNYQNSTPILDRIELVKALHIEGHTIIIHTARGAVTGLDLETLTRSQLDSWGLSFANLQMGKPFADLYVDDKGISDSQFFAAGVKEW